MNTQIRKGFRTSIAAAAACAVLLIAAGAQAQDWFDVEEGIEPVQIYVAPNGDVALEQLFSNPSSNVAPYPPQQTWNAQPPQQTWSAPSFSPSAAPIATQDWSQQQSINVLPGNSRSSSQYQYQGRLDVRLYTRRSDHSSWRAVNTSHIFRSGDQLRLQVQPSRSGYLAMVNIDTRGRAVAVRISTGSTPFSKRVSGGRWQPIPSTKWMTFDNSRGTEQLVFILSSRRLSDPVSVALGYGHNPPAYYPQPYPHQQPGHNSPSNPGHNYPSNPGYNNPHYGNGSSHGGGYQTPTFSNPNYVPTGIGAYPTRSSEEKLLTTPGGGGYTSPSDCYIMRISLRHY